MLITDKKELQKYTSEHRIWQGIPSIEVTKKGRIYSCFYSGGIKEELGNYAMLVMSDDGINFSEPIAVAYKDGYRCFDPCIWIDPLGRLWFTWSLIPEHGTYAAICNNPDSDELLWSDVFFIGHDVMMNKPTVLSTGEWLFSIAVWNNGIRVLSAEYDTKEKKRGSFVYKSIDNGKSFKKLGCSEIDKRSFDEHMVIELKNGSLAMFVRTDYGIGVSYSFDGGNTWTKGVDSGIISPSSRFFIRRLKSGRILLITNASHEIRNNLTAFLSEDECKTWKYQLLLDERDDVSYPDAAVDKNGYIYVTYDRERGAFKKNLNEVYSCSREILYSKITEADIMAGKIVNSDSKLKCIISRLGKYCYEEQNPFEEPKKFSDTELAKFLLENHPNNIPDKIFEYYSVNCVNMHKIEAKEFDKLTDILKNECCDKMQITIKMIKLVRSVSDIKIKNYPIVDLIKKTIIENLSSDLSIAEIAEKLGISLYYMAHVFKKVTCITITEYKKSLKLAYAKRMLVDSEKSMTEIAQECGFGSSSYFSKIFVQYEGMSPSNYRSYVKKQLCEEKN